MGRGESHGPYFLEEDNKQTHQHAHDGGKGRQLAVVHEDGLGQDLAEDHIQHGAAGKAKAQRQTQRADLAQQVAKQSADNGGDTGGGGDQHRFYPAHAAADQRHGHRHTLGNVVQTDENGKHQRRAAHHAVVAGVGRADGHALRHIVQRNGAGHDDAGNEQGELIVVLGVVLLQMVAVDQLIQIVSGLRVVFIDMGHFRVGFPVDEVVQQENDRDTQRNSTDDGEDAYIGLNGFRHQIKADNAQHHAAGKA